MIYFDVTNAVRSTHQSGLIRVSTCLRQALARLPGVEIDPVLWKDGGWVSESGKRVSPTLRDWLLTPEVFGPDERPGFAGWISAPPCRTAAVYYDAIPLKFPAITWPRSVGRHPAYMKQLAKFDRVFAISEASREELLGYWSWMGLGFRANVVSFPLGADGDGRPRATREGIETPRNALLMVGIVEPRKNQKFMMEVCEELWDRGLEFELHVIGRLNPHFGNPIQEHARTLAGKHACMRYHGPLDDADARGLRATCRAAVFPSLAEGNGLPVLEALWGGVPCLCSRIAAIEENAAGGGCVLLPVSDKREWGAAIRAILTDDKHFSVLREQALSRALPTWAGSAASVAAALAG